MKTLLACFTLLLLSSGLYAQNSFPPFGKAGIGAGAGSLNALQIQYISGSTDSAILRVSNGMSSGSNIFGILGLMPAGTAAYSSISTGEDLILHEQSQGDIILTNFQSTSLSHPYGAIRFATTPSLLQLPTPPIDVDYERLTILPNGNIGIDLPPDTGINFGLSFPRDQVQIGGGVMPYPGNPYIEPGLTIYGGNRFENMPKYGGGEFPGDWRYISFNHWVDHIDSSSARSHRFAPTSSSTIAFSENYGGNIDLSSFPYDSIRGLNDFSKSMTMEIRGSEGIQTWFMDTTSNPYHHLLDIFLPGLLPSPVTRNTNGLTFIHTPLCISSDHGGDPLLDFTNFANVHPDIGDGLTWTLVVNGPELAKEVFVLDSAWADYVFDPTYTLTPIEEVERFMKENHHLPDIPPASALAKSGVPLERTEKQLTKQLEEAMLYIGQLSHKIDTLESEVEDLKNKEK